MSDLYLLIEGQQQGPFTEEQVRESLAEGLIPGDLPAWREGLSEWQRVESLVRNTISLHDLAPVQTLDGEKQVGYSESTTLESSLSQSVEKQTSSSLPQQDTVTKSHRRMAWIIVGSLLGLGLLAATGTRYFHSGSSSDRNRHPTLTADPASNAPSIASPSSDNEDSQSAAWGAGIFVEHVQVSTPYFGDEDKARADLAQLAHILGTTGGPNEVDSAMQNGKSRMLTPGLKFKPEALFATISANLQNELVSSPTALIKTTYKNAPSPFQKAVYSVEGASDIAFYTITTEDDSYYVGAVIYLKAGKKDRFLSLFSALEAVVIDVTGDESIKDKLASFLHSGEVAFDTTTNGRRVLIIVNKTPPTPLADALFSISITPPQ